MKIRSMRTVTLAGALVLSATCGVTACSSNSEKTEPSATTTGSSATGTTSPQTASTASSASGTSTSANSTPASSTEAPSQPSAPSSHALGQPRGPHTDGVQVTSTTYLNGAYEILVTTRPGASFVFAPAVGAPRACTIVQRKPKGILTTHLVRCTSERVDKASLEVRYAATPSDAPIVVPLVTTGS